MVAWNMTHSRVGRRSWRKQRGPHAFRGLSRRRLLPLGAGAAGRARAHVVHFALLDQLLHHVLALVLAELHLRAVQLKLRREREDRLVHDGAFFTIWA